MLTGAHDTAVRCGPDMKRIVKWTVLALLVIAAAGIAREPLFWQRYFSALALPSGLPPSFYEPRDLIAGGNEKCCAPTIPGTRSCWSAMPA